LRFSKRTLAAGFLLLHRQGGFMGRYFRNESAPQGAAASPPSAAWLFAQAVLGNPLPSPAAAEAEARAKREQYEFLAAIAPERARELRGQLCPEVDARANRELLEFLEQIAPERAHELRDRLREEADPRAQREQLEWPAAISPTHESQLRSRLRTVAEPSESQARWQWPAGGSSLHEAQWDSDKHPRGAFPQNRGWWSPAGGSAGANRSTSLTDFVVKRNAIIAELTGLITPDMIRTSRLAIDLQSVARLPSEVARAAAAGLGTGGKAVVNGFATAIKNVATLGLSTGQLELIGVTKEDRARGYDTAVAISTASGQVLIAVGTGGMASALSKGGSIARTASGALVAFDAAGNAVGVVQGVYDATQNGVSISNGAQVAGGLLGLGANAKAAKSLTAPRAHVQVPNTIFRVGKHGEMPTPRPGQHSHHGIMSAWMKEMYSGYDPKKAPAILMPDINHLATFGIYRRWRAEMARKLGGTFDWSKVSEAEMRALSEKMFDAAQVPSSIRHQYWAEFEKMKAALRK